MLMRIVSCVPISFNIYFTADTLLPVLTDQFFKTAGFILTSIILITLAFPFFLLVVIPIFVILYLPYKFCKKGIQETKM